VRGSNYPERWLEIPLRTSLITTRSSGEVTTGSSAQCSVSERVGRFAFPRRRAFSTVNIYTGPSRAPLSVQVPTDRTAKSRCQCPKPRRLTARAAIVDAVHSHSNGTASLHAKDHNEFVEEVLKPIHGRLFPSFSGRPTSFRLHFSFFCSWLFRWTDRSFSDPLWGGISCAGSVDWETLTFYWRCRFSFLHPFLLSVEISCILVV